MDKKGVIRRSRRLREKRRSRGKEGRKSVGDDLGVTPIRGKAVNLAEARAMQDARAAAGAWDDDNVHAHRGKSGRKKKRRSRGRSLPARREPHAMAGSARKARSVAGTPRRLSRRRSSRDAWILDDDPFLDSIVGVLCARAAPLINILSTSRSRSQSRLPRELLLCKVSDLFRRRQLGLCFWINPD